VVTLHWVGVNVAVALSATLLFRGLTFGYRCCPVSGWRIANGIPPRQNRRMMSAPIIGARRSAVVQHLAQQADGVEPGPGQGSTAQRAAPGQGPATGIGQLVLEQMRTPLVLILIAGAVVAVVVGDRLDAAIVGCIVLISAVLSAWYENRASHAVEQLRNKIALRATVRREARPGGCRQ
jgi:Mg2+-importing ATPase